MDIKHISHNINKLINEHFKLPKYPVSILGYVTKFIVNNNVYHRRDDDTWKLIFDCDDCEPRFKIIKQDDIIQVLIQEYLFKSDDDRFEYVITWIIPHGIRPNVQIIVNSFIETNCMTYNIGYFRNGKDFIVNRNKWYHKDMSDISCEIWHIIHLSYIEVVYNICDNL